jgi:Holliday junction DNA helicase RuvB
MNTDIANASPSSIRHLIGQEGVIRQVAVALDAAQQDGKKFDHSLLVGPPGCGKTATSQIIAKEMAGGFIELLGQTIKSAADLNAALLEATDRSIVFIDEAHELPRTVQTALYLSLDQKKVILNGSRKGSVPTTIDIADFTLLLASTDEYQLLQPPRDRMRLTLRFDFYSEADLATILDTRARALGWQVEAGVYGQIAPRSRGTPRIALRLLASAHRCSRAAGCDTIGTTHLHQACELENVDSLGLGPAEQKYLRILLEGPTRLNMLGSRLGLPAKTIEKVFEQNFLIRAGLIEKDEQARRVLTATGRKHAQSLTA